MNDKPKKQDWRKRVKKGYTPARNKFYRTKPIKKWVNRGTSSN